MPLQLIPLSRPDVARKGRTWIAALFDDAPLAILNPDQFWSEITASVRRLVRSYGHRWPLRLDMHGDVRKAFREALDPK